MRSRVGLFVFYFMYLIGAELPFFIILWNRNLKEKQHLIIISILFLLSIIINIVIYTSIIKNIKSYLKGKNNNVLSVNDFETVSPNKLKESLMDFFAIFLLPFFTFNFSSESNIYVLVTEIIVIFLLLTIFLFRTNNLTANIIIYLIFNVYECQIPGKNIIVITSDTKMDLESESVDLLRIFDNFYFYSSNNHLLKKKLAITNSILILLAIIMIVVTYKLVLG
ncbi:hypothetical protein ACQKOA_04925 [Bacillus mobilis]|uniref:hypothetical protein n=1 Tax=Bacillus mobilis TaxID=2026190 RepID=UPI003CFFAB9A